MLVTRVASLPCRALPLVLIALPLVLGAGPGGEVGSAPGPGRGDRDGGAPEPGSGDAERPDAGEPGAGEPDARDGEPVATRPRAIVLTDIGGDPDDTQSFVRLLLYTNAIDLEGIVVTGRVIRDGGPPLRPELVRERIRAYGACRDRLLEHADGWPTAEELLARVTTGLPVPKRRFDPETRRLSEIPVERKVGPGKDSDGSRWIIRQADRSEPRPLWVLVWGTPSDLAQALWRVREERSEEETAAFVDRLRVYLNGFQDLTNAWIHEEFPGLFAIQTGDPGVRGTYAGMYWGGERELASERWARENVQEHPSPLGSLYPRAKPYFKEGDTPTFLHVLPVGIGDPGRPDLGTWGGRFRRAERYWADLHGPEGARRRRHAWRSVWRWRPAFQNDFRARLDWTVRSREAANHPPRPALARGGGGGGLLELEARRGSSIALDAAGSGDPDGDSLDFRWSLWPRTTPAARAVRLRADGSRAGIAIPGDAPPGEAPVLLEVTDDGTPPLTRYRRVLLRIGE